LLSNTCCPDFLNLLVYSSGFNLFKPFCSLYYIIILKNFFFCISDGIEVALGDRKEYAVPEDLNETTSFKFLSLLVKIVSELKVM
jgi:hypothetical protein